jgi:hypothetical protein
LQEKLNSILEKYIQNTKLNLCWYTTSKIKYWHLK